MDGLEWTTPKDPERAESQIPHMQQFMHDADRTEDTHTASASYAGATPKLC